MNIKKLISHRWSASRYIALVLGLLIGLSWVFTPKKVSTDILASPQPEVEIINLPSEVLIGETFTFKVTFSNQSGNMPGYGPFIDLVLPAGGANTLKPCSPCDGITFKSAAMVDVVGGPVPLTPAQSSPPPIVAPCGSGPNPATHPFDANGVPPVTLPLGGQLVTLALPFESFQPTQPDIVVEITAEVSVKADNVPLEIYVRGGFRLGTDALDNDDDITNPDPPVLTDTDQNSINWKEHEPTTPNVIRVRKAYQSAYDENEAVTGPNFVGYYPLQYVIQVDIAENQPLTNLVVEDCLPGGMMFVGLVGTSHPPTTTTLPSLGNHCLTLTYASFTGTATDPDITATFEFYISDVTRMTCDAVDLKNDVKAEADWAPVDACDPPLVHVVSDATDADHTLTAKCIAVQKRVEHLKDADGFPIGDTGGAGYTPGDTLLYTITFQISDYMAMGAIEIEDVLSDGQKLVPIPGITTAPVPYLSVSDQFGTTEGPFTPNDDFFVTPGVDASCGAETSGTQLRMVVGKAMQNLAFSLNPRHKASVLTGGLALGPASTVPATGEITFAVQIQDEFSAATLAGDQKRFVDKHDPLCNDVMIRASKAIGDPPAITLLTGEDTSGTRIRIVGDTLEKSIYAINDQILPANAPKPIQVKAGDVITFRLTKTIPSGDAENLTIQDWLPLPVLNVNDPDPGCFVCVKPWLGVFSVCIGGTPPPGQACRGPADTVFSTLGLLPTVTPNTSDNSLTFTYPPTFNNTQNTELTIDILFSIRVPNAPFADGLLLTNEAQECEDGTFETGFCQVAITQFELAEPSLKVTKGIVATTNPNAMYQPAAPPPGTFASPGSPDCPRFSGTISSANLSSLHLDSDVSDVDANDCITFAIVVENTGSADAYDVTLRDTFPLGPTDIADCFLPVDQSLCVTDGTGATIPFTQSPGGFGSILITLQNPLPPLDSNNPGKNIVVITFDACLIGNIKAHCCDNRVRLERYAAVPNGPNFVDSHLGGTPSDCGFTTDPFTNCAEVCVLPETEKCIVATSELSTGNVGGVEQLAIGEIIRYRLQVVVPETITPFTYELQESLPSGLTYLSGTAVVALVSDGGLTSSTLSPGANVSDTDVEVTCSPPRPTPTFPINPGPPLTFNLGMLTNTEPNDSDQEFVILEFNALVNNVGSNQDGTTLDNSYTVIVTDEEGNKTTVSSKTVRAVVVEPAITAKKEVTVPPTDFGGTVTYTVTLTNTGSATAFDVRLTDTLPLCLENLDFNNITVTNATITKNNSDSAELDVELDEILPDDPASPGSHDVTVQYSARLKEACASCEGLINTVAVTWTSLPGNGTCSNPTGSCTPCTGVATCERDGSGGVNDYSTSARADLCTDLTIMKTAASDFTAGASGAYTITVKNDGNHVALPPVTVMDTLPVGLNFGAAQGTDWDCSFDTPNRKVTCTYQGPPVPPNTNFPDITLTVSVDPNAPSPLENCAMVTGANDSNPDNNTSCVRVEIKPAQCLVVVKEDVTCNPDGGYTYTLDIKNISGFPADVVRFIAVSPLNVAMTVDSVNPPLPILPGQTATVTVKISGPDAVEGAVICFLVSIHQIIVINGVEVEVNCCTAGLSVQKKITLPRCTGDICGMKFHDLDGDGVKDENEMTKGLGGFVIQLKDADGNPVRDADGNPVMTTTDAQGHYCFRNLPPGTYTVCEVLQSGWRQTYPTPIPPGTHTVTLQAGQVESDIDFGNIEDCLRIEHETITCSPDGTFKYTFELTNLAFPPVNVKYVFLVPVSPSVTISPVITRLSLEIGFLEKATITVTISGANSGDQVCFRVAPHDAQVRDCCAEEQVRCITLPTCKVQASVPGKRGQAPTLTRQGQHRARLSRGATEEPPVQRQIRNPMNLYGRPSLGTRNEVVMNRQSPMRQIRSRISRVLWSRRARDASTSEAIQSNTKRRAQQ